LREFVEIALRVRDRIEVLVLQPECRMCLAISFPIAADPSTRRLRGAFTFAM